MLMVPNLAAPVSYRAEALKEAICLQATWKGYNWLKLSVGYVTNAVCADAHLGCIGTQRFYEEKLGAEITVRNQSYTKYREKIYDVGQDIIE